MDEQIKQRWLEALRSGEYQQTKGTLHDTKGFCCLGVLCDVLKNDPLFRGEWVYNGGKVAQFVEEGGESSMALPSEVFMQRMGIDRNDPYTQEPRVFTDGDIGKHRLATLNDEGYTFAEIADIIERDL